MLRSKRERARRPIGSVLLVGFAVSVLLSAIAWFIYTVLPLLGL